MYVVTGAAGFIGSHIAAALRPVECFDGLDDGTPSRVLGALRARTDVSAVIHMGAISDTGENDADRLARLNTAATVDLFDLCAERGWPFIYASSASVYGASLSQSDDDRLASWLAPMNPYAQSKASADLRIIRAERTPPKWTGLRLFNVYGPGEDHKGAQKSFVSHCFDAIREKRPIRLFEGSDGYLRDWVYVGDVARLVADLIAHDASCGVINVGTGTATSFSDVARLCLAVSGSDVGIETIAFPRELVGRYQAYTRAETRKLKAHRPDFCFTALDDGAAAYWKEISQWRD